MVPQRLQVSKRGEPRIGLSVAKNTGVGLARGRLLLFTDDDVIVDPDWVRSYLDFFARHREDSIVAGGPIVPVAADLGPWPRWFDSCALPDVGLLDHAEERPLGRYEYIWGANMAVPAGIFAVSDCGTRTSDDAERRAEHSRTPSIRTGRARTERKCGSAVRRRSDTAFRSVIPRSPGFFGTRTPAAATSFGGTPSRPATTGRHPRETTTSVASAYAGTLRGVCVLVSRPPMPAGAGRVRTSPSRGVVFGLGDGSLRVGRDRRA